MENKIVSDDLELEAILLFTGHTAIRDAFLELTDQGHIHLKTNPMEKKFRWEAPGRPTEKDIERDAAVWILIDSGLIADMEDCGTADFSAISAEKAEKVRAIYDQLPKKLKNKIFDKEKPEK